MAVRELLVRSREPHAGGELLHCSVRYEVDPADPANAAVTDLGLLGPGPVAFEGDLDVLRPPSGGHGGLVVEIPNRGGARIPYGDGFLLERGWTLAWCGWQWDIERGTTQLGLSVPEVPASGSVRVEFNPLEPCAEHPLDRDLVGRPGRAIYPAADVAQPDAALYVREPATGRRETVPRGRWHFTADGTRVALEGGFSPAWIYEVVYRPARCPVGGLGFAAVRDAVSHLRAGGLAPVYAFGVSQSGRFLRQLLYHGFNLDEAGRQVFDGIHIHVAGARRGEFNARHGQPSVAHAPGFCDLPPFEPAGLLAEQRRRGGLPRVLITNSAWEYWRGDASLGHIRDGRDLPDDPDVRMYLLSGGDHLGGAGGVPAENPANDLVYEPLLRAAFVRLDQWAREGVAPPPSRIPRVADGTAALREQVWAALGAVPGFRRPSPEGLPRLFEVDLGPDAGSGIGRYPVELGDPFPVWVPAVDADGNDVGGIRLPDLSVPVATITGWNVSPYGVLANFVGSTLPFARTREERLGSGDPRPSVEERYRGRDAYEARVRVATAELLAEDLLLAEDVEPVVAACLRRHDRITRA